jgi:hypothetical protein
MPIKSVSVRQLFHIEVSDCIPVAKRGVPAHAKLLHLAERLSEARYRQAAIGCVCRLIRLGRCLRVGVYSMISSGRTPTFNRLASTLMKAVASPHQPFTRRAFLRAATLTPFALRASSLDVGIVGAGLAGGELRTRTEEIRRESSPHFAQGSLSVICLKVVEHEGRTRTHGRRTHLGMAVHPKNPDRNERRPLLAWSFVWLDQRPLGRDRVQQHQGWDGGS